MPTATRSVVGSIIARRIPISRFDDESAPCSGFEARRRCKNSAQFMLRSTTISISSAISSLARSTNNGEPVRWPSGGPSRPNGRLDLSVLRRPPTTCRYSDKAGASVQPMVVGVIYFMMAIGSMLRPRWLPQKSFPPYAYLPGKKPHPVRDPTGHSYHVEPIPVAAEASLGSETFLWGLDLFNHGYYWEAHEAWEGLWQGADRDGPLCMLLKGLILLSAAGIKIREGEHAAAVRHTGRAAALLRRLMKVPDRAFERALGMSPAALAENAEAASRIPAALHATAPGQPQPVFNFILGSNSRGRPRGSQKRN